MQITQITLNTSDAQGLSGAAGLFPGLSNLAAANRLGTSSPLLSSPALTAPGLPSLTSQQQTLGLLSQLLNVLATLLLPSAAGATTGTACPSCGNSSCSGCSNSNSSGGGGSTGGASGGGGTSSSSSSGGSSSSSGTSSTAPSGNVDPSSVKDQTSTSGLSQAAINGLNEAHKFGLPLVSGKRSGSGTSDHNHGDAIDVGTIPIGAASSTGGTPQMKAFAEHMRQEGKAGRSKVKYIIRDGEIASSRDNWEWRPYTYPGKSTAELERLKQTNRGEYNRLQHYDHVHVSFND